MSSQILLEEITSTLRPVIEKPKLFTSGPKEKDKIEGLIVTEQVRLASLRRQQELVAKLADELPGRISQIAQEAGELERQNAALRREEEARMKIISSLRVKNQNLEIEFKRVANALRLKRESESVAIFQKEKIYETISRIVDVRKSLAGRFTKPVPTKGDDVSYLSLRIEQNDALLKEIDARLADIVDAHF